MTRHIVLPSLRTALGQQPWRKDAACRDLDPNMFFVHESDEEGVAHAKSVCAECPVIEECLDHAVWVKEMGVWGGTTETERRKIRRIRQAERRQRLMLEAQRQNAGAR